MATRLFRRSMLGDKTPEHLLPSRSQAYGSSAHGRQNPFLGVLRQALSRSWRSVRWVGPFLLASITAIVIFSPSPRIINHIFPGHPSSRIALTREQLQSLYPQAPSTDKQSAGDTHRQLRIFMPADAPNINLCKEIMSAVALGYPPPTLLNWKGEFNRLEWHLAGSHIAKLTSLLAVIEELLDQPGGDTHEDDIALLVDAYDMWFQLPPSVLISRFHQINHEAEERVRRSWQSDSPTHGFPAPSIRQNIIITSAKHCSPLGDSGSNPHYEYWPESPMPSDLYGDGTDEVIRFMLDPARKYQKIRPRCVNSGLIMGTMGGLRNALQRAKEKVEEVERHGRQLWSDQALIGEVIGDQEMWRRSVREAASTWNGTASELDMGALPSEVQRIIATALGGTNFEFGIGLDYNFTTAPPTCSAEEDGYFVHLNDAAELKRESDKAGVPGAMRVQGVPSELIGAPFKDDPLKDVPWADVPLYTDFYFGVTPVAIHHNAYVNNLKPRRLKEWWDHMWFYPNLRTLVTAQLRPSHPGSPQRPLGRVRVNGADLTYWPSEMDQQDRSVKVFEPATEDREASFAPISWDGVCQKGRDPWYEELFGDGEGPLVQ